MKVFYAIPALALFVAAGASILRAVDRSGDSGLSGAPFIGASFLAGMAAVSLQMFLYSLAGVPFRPALISLPWIAFVAVVFFVLKRPRAQKGPEKERFGILCYALLAVIAAQAAYAFAYALTLPLFGWDAWFIWFYKARAFYLDGAVSGEFLSGQTRYHHGDYPLLVPLAAAWMYSAAGSADEALGKLLWPLQLLSLLSIMYFAVSKVADRRTGLLFAALLSLVPVVAMHSGGLPVKIGELYSGDFVGYADLLLSACFLAAGALFYLYALEGRAPLLIFSALFLGIGAWTKNEGLTFALFGVLLFGAYRLRQGRGGARDALAMALTAAAFIVPWALFKGSFGIGSEYVENLSAEVVASNLWKLGVILKTLGRMVFSNIELYSLCWWAYAISVLANWRGLAAGRLLILHALMAAQLSAYVLVYVISPAPVDWHVTTSADRLLLHLIPLAVFITAVNLTDVVRAWGGFGRGLGQWR